MKEREMRIAITGAATGIGAAVAAKLKAENHTIVAFDVAEPQNVDQWVSVDLSDPAAIDKAIAAVKGPFDALINNAGLPPRAGLTEKILAVNVLGLVALTEGLLPMLAPGAAIVNTASRAGAAWRDNLKQVKALLAVGSAAEIPAFVKDQDIDHIRAYNLSKEAVIVWGMGQTERLIAKDLRVNSVSPAAVSTGILDDFLTAFGEKTAKNIARAGRPGNVEEIADIIVFLAGPNSRWLKGTDIVIDGGMSAMIQSDMLELRAGN
jgi:NAD(P)-dependent dehydrogenase (short-subunit alcohol dehydrogenase family)